MIVVWAVLAPACTCNKSGEATADAGATPASATVTPTSSAPAPTGDAGPAGPWVAVPGATAAILPNMGFAERFDTEKRARPNAKPNADDAYAALQASGLTLTEKKQHLASPLGARYCFAFAATAGTTALLQLSLCEYASADLAASSAKFSEDSLKGAMPTRTVIPNKQIALVLRQDVMTPEGDAAKKKATDAFKKL